MDANLRSIAERIESSVGPLSATETQAGFPGHWSLQEVVQHLMLTYTSTADIVRDRLLKGRPTQSKPRFEQHLKRLAVVRFGRFPTGIPAPKAVTPSGDGPQLAGTELATRAAAELSRLDDVLEQAARLFGERTRSVSHIILGPLNPGEWRRFHRVHGLHHLRQIEEIRRKILWRC